MLCAARLFLLGVWSVARSPQARPTSRHYQHNLFVVALQAGPQERQALSAKIGYDSALLYSLWIFFVVKTAVLYQILSMPVKDHAVFPQS